MNKNYSYLTGTIYFKAGGGAGGGGRGSGGGGQGGKLSANNAAEKYAQGIIDDPLSDSIAAQEYKDLKGVRMSNKQWVEGFKQSRGSVLKYKQEYVDKYSNAMDLAKRAKSALKRGNTTEWRRLSTRSDKLMSGANRVLDKMKREMGFLAIAAERTGNTK